MKVYIALFLCSFFVLNLQGQSKTDSLEKVLKTSRKNDTTTVILLKQICREYIDLNNEKLEKHAKYMLEISEKINFTKGKADALNFLGIVKDIESDYPQALNYYKEALVLAKKTNAKQTIASIGNNIGLIEWKTGDLKKALISFFDALKQAEALNNTKLQGNISSNIGLVFQDLKKYNDALSWQQKALALRLKKEDNYGLASTYTNLSSVYSYLNKSDKAIDYQKKAIILQQKINDEYGLGISYLNLGAEYKILKNYSEALKYYLLSKSIREKNDDQLGLSFTYMSIATLYKNLHKYKEAIASGEKSLAIAYKIKSDERISENSYGLSNIYREAGNPEKALELIHQYTDYHEKVFNQEMSKKVSELNVKYKTEEKENQLNKSRLLLAKKENEARNRNFWLFGAIGLAAITLVASIYVHRQQLEKHKLVTKILTIDNENKLNEQRLDISRDLHDSLGSQLTFINTVLDSLKSPSVEISEKLNSKINTLSDFSENSINELKNTIWALNAKELYLNDLKLKILNFVKNATEAKEDIQFNFDFNVANNFELNSKQAINLFRVFQEIVNNTFKYAQAKNISASIKQHDNNLIMQIADDGIGFNLAEQENKSYGINNIKSRITELNGKLAIETAPNKGTRYEIEISLI